MRNLLIFYGLSGQAGRGNNEEFGLLSLEFDENFCMGGPGIIMSRQTLKRGKRRVVALSAVVLTQSPFAICSCSSYSNVFEESL